MSELKVTGDISAPMSLTHDSMTRMNEAARVADVRTLGSARKGGGVRLAEIVRAAGVPDNVRYVSFISRSDNFRVCVPLARVRDSGVVIHHIDGREMTRGDGGPFRFIIPDPAACGTEVIDECVNVKYLDEISLTIEPGEDTRPSDEEEHARLHERERAAES